MLDGRKRQGLRDVKKELWGGSPPWPKLIQPHGQSEALVRGRQRAWDHREVSRALGHLKPINPSPLSPSTTSSKEDAKWLQWVTHQFETIAGEDGEIDLQDFKKALNVKEASVHSRIGTLHLYFTEEEQLVLRTQYLTRRESLLPRVPPDLRPHF